MRIENAVVAEVLERMLSAYGFSMQKELAEHLDIAKSNVAGWIQRGQVPGNAIIQCVLDTGADLNWIINGEFEKASSSNSALSAKGKKLYDKVIANGGRVVLQRILDAYGFTTQKQLCDLFDMSSGTVSTWIRRNYFPGDIVVTCALDTGANLEWLVLGNNSKHLPSDDIQHSCIQRITKYRLESGKLKEAGNFYADNTFLNNSPKEPIYIEGINNCWFVDRSQNNLSNGKWVISIDGALDVFDVVKIPRNNVRLIKSEIEFECSESEIDVYGVVFFTMHRHI